jgi:hypothetical protein
MKDQEIKSGRNFERRTCARIKNSKGEKQLYRYPFQIKNWAELEALPAMARRN